MSQVFGKNSFTQTHLMGLNKGIIKDTFKV